jgi:hypothetical protein
VSTKYAKARDTAGQWKSELRKAQRENRSLRKVYAAAKDVLNILDVTGVGCINEAVALRDALRNAVFAEPPKEPT